MTWDDVKRAAVNDAHLHAAVYRVERLHEPREQALIDTVFSLSAANKALAKGYAVALARECPNPRAHLTAVLPSSPTASE
jgi:hypothetical protein